MGKAKGRAWDFFHEGDAKPISPQGLLSGLCRDSPTGCHGQRRYRCPFTEEEQLMELLGAEHSDEEPDDGELEGSGDDYDKE
ncbi:hypothetical protein C8R44DRAFT_761877 [Mycena epipterygia]|nr:hypothetical protein C8R44DRAFT_791036 [Mycena epipterygia]KAJ7140777.1 hypothetical protein C8R44DRAFT_761861 [Mycena epipterygia]KAJ7140783.1 hypothetical protein C8R44DRAFT_761877 [Mycena epipterygia]